MSPYGLLQRRTFLFGSGLLIAALLIGASTAGIGMSAASADPAPPTQGLEYVALGDSYSAGYGLTPLTGLPVPGCAQSSSNYPHQLAAVLELTLTDVTCSGAVTANIVDTPQVTPAGTNPVQSLALSATTDIVTITIGGNDLGFSNIIGACVAASPAGPTFLTATPMPDCKSIFAAGGVDALAAKIQLEVAPAVSNTFALVQEKAPNAKIFVLAYPALMPDAVNTPAVPSGCFVPVFDGTSFVPNSYPFTTVDVPYLNGVQSMLDSAIKGAADGIGATYVPMFTETLGHTPCAGTPVPFLNGITLTSSSGDMVPGAMHPNAAGTAFMTEQARVQIVDAMEAPLFTSGAPASGVVSAAYSFAVTASGFPAPTFAVTSGALPAGLTLNPDTGVITGTPTATGVSTFALTATNSSGSAVSPSYYTLTVNSVPALTSGAPTGATVGASYAFTVTATGVPAPTFQIASGALPAGLNLNSATGEIIGTPTTAGPAVFGITATNAAGTATSPEYTITTSPPNVAPAITSGLPPEGKVGLAYAFTVTAGGYPAPTFTVSSGALPAGLTLNSTTGAITGVPLTAGSSRFAITASNQVVPDATASYTLAVQAAAPPAPAPTPTASAPGLATAGADLASTGAAGLLILLAGVGLLMRRRKTRHSTNR